MSIIDPIADMLTRIRNALLIKEDSVIIDFSKVKFSIVKILKDEGYIKNFEINNIGLNRKQIKVNLKYDENGDPIISKLTRVSTSSKRIYVPKNRIRKVLNGFGINIVSTPKGILTGKNARINNVGGELMAEIY